MTEVVTVQVEGLSQVLNLLQQLPPELVSKNGGVVRKALRKGSLLVLNQAKDNLQAIIDRDANGDSTGTLKSDVVTQRMRKPQPYSEGFVVHIKRGKKVRNMTAAEYGALLERGDERQVAQPWMTPAYFGKREESLQVIVRESERLTEEVIRKFEASGGVVDRGGGFLTGIEKAL